MNLLIDIGNTRLKWAILQDDDLMSSHALVNDEITRHLLIALWKFQPLPEKLAIACVGSASLLELITEVAVVLWPKVDILYATSQGDALGVCNAYQCSEKLGVDRWLALVAVRHFYQSSACIVDCGTAITIDLINVDGKHLGGFISPGLMLMRKSLSTGTARLPSNETDYEVGPASFTEAAIYSGTLFAAVGLIEHVLSKQPNVGQLILTGGDAEIVAAQLKYKLTIDNELVLRGLVVVLEGQR